MLNSSLPIVSSFNHLIELNIQNKQRNRIAIKRVKNKIFLLDPNPIGNGPIKPTTDHSVFPPLLERKLPSIIKAIPKKMNKTPTATNFSLVIL